MRPKTVEIIGQVFTVEFQDMPLIVGGVAEQKVGATTVGYSTTTSGELIIAEGQSFFSERDTILHEVLHGVTDLTGLSHALGENKNEDVVSRLTAPLLDVLRSNPDLVAYLTEPPLEADECIHHQYGPNCEECGSE